MFMNQRLVAGLMLIILVTIPGCKEGALSVEECKTIREHELKLMNSLLNPSSIDPKSANDASDKTIAKCMSGEMYSRKDYECIVSATTSTAMSHCMAQAHEKAGR